MDFVSVDKNTLLLYVTVSEKIVPRLNKHDDVIEWNFVKIAREWRRKFGRRNSLFVQTRQLFGNNDIYKSLLLNSSGVTDGGKGVRAAPPGKLNVKNGPPLEIPWTAEYKSASTIFGNPLVLTF